MVDSEGHFVCRFCDRAYKFKHSLKKHLPLHRGKQIHQSIIEKSLKQGMLYLKFSINYFTAYPNTDDVSPTVTTHQQSTGVNTNDKGKLSVVLSILSSSQMSRIGCPTFFLVPQIFEYPSFFQSFKTFHLSAIIGILSCS